MSFQVAFRSEFHSVSNIRWRIDILLPDYVGTINRFSFSGDVSIEWGDTDKLDSVQSSRCTLKMVNDNDRQFIRLMYQYVAKCKVYRNNLLYWAGMLDDSIYEEPYSYLTNYETEITFSDFGFLNRVPFNLSGIHTIGDIINSATEAANIYEDVGTWVGFTSISPEKGNLFNLRVSVDGLKKDGDGFGDFTSWREAIEEVLKPFGLRMIQRKGIVYIYDIESLRDSNAEPVVWKGTDAYIRSDSRFGWFEVAFDPGTKDVIADGELGYDKSIMEHHLRFAAENVPAPAFLSSNIAFLIDFGPWNEPEGFWIGNGARLFKTQGVLQDFAECGVAWRVAGYNVDREEFQYLLNTTTPRHDCDAIFSIETPFIPCIPRRDDYELRLCLDIFFGVMANNPMWDKDTEITNPSAIKWRKSTHVFLPVKLELLDEDGDVVMHFENAHVNSGFAMRPLTQPGTWENGAAEFGQMCLSYYKDYSDDDEIKNAVCGDWATNRMSILIIQGTSEKIMYQNRDDGEYVPLPPEAGRLRLTVGNGVENSPTDTCNTYLSWQLYRNPKITMVRKAMRKDEISKDKVYERDMVNFIGDNISLGMKFGSWVNGIAPSSSGLVFDSFGDVCVNFVKNDVADTLQVHRLHNMISQYLYTNPVLEGTAEMETDLCSFSDGSTPGKFMMTSLKQNIHEETEEIKMVMISDDIPHYQFRWGNHVCAKEEIPYSFEWSDKICAKQETSSPVEDGKNTD